MRRAQADASPFHFTYINLVPGEEILVTLTAQLSEALAYIIASP